MVENAASIALIEAIARLENCPSTELGPTLGIVLSDTLDSETLDRLVTTGEPVSVAFSIGEYDVTLTEKELLVRTT
ncbi:HalOD1 output domain-containing protein [Natrononativus amylolyticus]|uniref:HalOD1 output domain-containing protein n=1 Tax=Natrononativus amylolyticus TaxID=2963434 RepID=UPI0020CF8D59|nr:HalOD1 output domain-containing protein [Natrononativus amylolyticus]